MSKSKAFIAEEITCLEELVLKYKHIVTTKKSDSATVALKQKTWMTIEKEFNAQGLFLNRTADQLKKRWENMLQSRKKEIAAEKQERRKTGGEQVTVVTNQSSIDELIDNTVNIEIPNIIDSDHFEIIYADDINDNLSEEMFPCTPKTNQHQPESTMLLKTTHPIKQTPNVKDILNDKKCSLLDKEASLRIKRLELSINHDEQLFQLAKKKCELEIKLTENKVLILEKELLNDIHPLKPRKGSI